MLLLHVSETICDTDTGGSILKFNQLCHTKGKSNITNIQEQSKLFWAQDQLRSGKVCCGLTSPHFKSILETMDIVSFGRKRKKTIQSVTSEKFKGQHLWTYVGVLVPMAWGQAHLWMHCSCWDVKSGYTTTYATRWHLILGCSAYSSKTMWSHILHVLQKPGFVLKEWSE